MSELAGARLVDQRIRNRVIESLELLAEGDKGLASVGDVEYFEMFFDWVDDDIPGDWRANSAYSAAEVERVDVVYRAMVAAVRATAGMDAEATAASGWPARIQPEAQVALDLMLSRGRFDEEREEDEPSR